MSRVCLQCGADAPERDGEFILWYGDCESCGERVYFGTEEEYAQR